MGYFARAFDKTKTTHVNALITGTVDLDSEAAFLMIVQAAASEVADLCVQLVDEKVSRASNRSVLPTTVDGFRDNVFGKAMLLPADPEICLPSAQITYGADKPSLCSLFT